MPVVAMAAVQDIMLEDIDAWQQSVAEDGARHALDLSDTLWQEAPELFPEVTIEEDRGTLEQQRDDRLSAVVTVTIQGKLVAFKDLPRTEWYSPYARGVLEQGIMSGYKDAQGNPTGEFKPGQGVTIEELAKIAVNLSGGVKDTCPAKPVNVTASGSWSMQFVSCAEQKGWAVFSDGSVDVKKEATRAQVVVTMLQAFNVDMSQAGGSGAFLDVTSSTEFSSAIGKAKLDGIVSGYTNNEGTPTGMFGPMDPVKRAEIAKIVSVTMGIYGE